MMMYKGQRIFFYRDSCDGTVRCKLPGIDIGPESCIHVLSLKKDACSVKVKGHLFFGGIGIRTYAPTSITVYALDPESWRNEEWMGGIRICATIEREVMQWRTTEKFASLSMTERWISECQQKP